MGGWRHCAEVVFFVFVAVGAIASVAIAIIAVAGAWRAARPLREPVPLPKRPAAEDLSEERKKQLADHWEAWRKRCLAHATEYNHLINPLRKDTIDILKEAANWGRLAVQYALIGNGGALAALPYLLSNTTRLELPIVDAIWSAMWFATGLFSAALCCLIAYMDFQVSASIYWADQRVTGDALRQRHFETGEVFDLEPHISMRNTLQSVNVRTSLAGVVLGLISWFALAWGAFRLIISLSP